jgi:hypothetical protein
MPRAQKPGTEDKARIADATAQPKIGVFPQAPSSRAAEDLTPPTLFQRLIFAITAEF